MAAEPERADEPGALPTTDSATDATPAPAAGEQGGDDEVRPEDVREDVVDLVAYTVGAVALVLLGYFTQRGVLTWTRGPFTVVVVIMAVHWVGRRVQARRARAQVRTGHDNAEGAR